MEFSVKTEIHSSRMRTVCSSSRLQGGGVSASVHAGKHIHPLWGLDTPSLGLGLGLKTPSQAWAWTPPRADPWAWAYTPLVWAWNPPRAWTWKPPPRPGPGHLPGQTPAPGHGPGHPPPLSRPPTPGHGPGHPLPMNRMTDRQV